MEWISILKCPVTGNDLRELEQDEIVILQQKMLAQQLWRSDGQPLAELIERALIEVNGAYIYPIIKEIRASV